ncbi:MAG: glycosyltransferase family 4 protein [Oceanipulchritudo sp.]
MKVLFLSIVPSPYQRDLFACLHDLEGIDIQVRYAEAGSPDSPWPKEQLAHYEQVYRSFYLSWGGKRFIVNSQLPSVEGFDAVVLNGYVTVPAQWLLRVSRTRVPLLFWGEKLERAQGGIRERMQGILTRPMRNLAAIVAIGKQARRDYKERFPGMPVYEVPYYCRIDAFQKSVPQRPREPVRILFCGQMIHRKGVDLLLEAFAGLVTGGLDVRLILVGREAELPGMLEDLPVPVRERIEYAGFQPPEALPRYFTEADIFVLPSRYDGWGVVVNQALGAGLPVICSDAVGAAEDLVETGRNGYLFPSGDGASLQARLRELVRSPKDIRRFASRSLEKSRDITPMQGARDWERILTEVTGGSHD